VDAVRIDSRSPHHHQHPVAARGDLFELRLQPPLRLACQGRLEFVATVADLRLRVLEAGIEVDPLQVRIDGWSMVARSPRAYASYASRIRSSFWVDIESSPFMLWFVVDCWCMCWGSAMGAKPLEERRLRGALIRRHAASL